VKRLEDQTGVMMIEYVDNERFCRRYQRLAQHLSILQVIISRSCEYSKRRPIGSMTYDERRHTHVELPDPSSWVLRKRSWVIYREWGEIQEGRGVRVSDTEIILGALWRITRL